MGVLANVRPFDLGARAARSSRQEFIDGLRCETVLVVALAHHPDSLFKGLMECPTDENSTWYPRSESTGSTTKFLTVHRSSGKASMRAPFTSADLTQLLATPQFIAPLRKRSGALMRDDERITVGRSNANDIVLHHEKVSKLHAWLEYDDRERCYVCDAGSTNQTRVAGQVIAPNDLVPFHLGDPIDFGSVTVRICKAGMLWDAINSD